MENQREKIAQNTVDITKSIFSAISLIIKTIYNFIIGILKGLYDFINQVTNNAVNSILYYLFGFIFWIGVIGIIPTILTSKLSLKESIISFVVGIMLLIIKYILYRATERYSDNISGVKSKNMIDKFFLTTIIIVLSSIVIIYATISIL